MNKTIITADTDYPVQPKHIDATKHFYNAFDNNETEVSAGWIVRFCQQRESWASFTKGDIESFYQKSGFSGFRFNQLTNRNWVKFGEGRRYSVTHDFIARCFLSEPVLTVEETVTV